LEASGEVADVEYNLESKPMSKQFIPFAQERVMSKWENVVDYNLGDSGVHPITIAEFVDDPKVIERMLSTGLYHPQANGILELREHIASLYPGVTPDNVLVTSGAAQANFTAIWTLLKPGDEIVVMLPSSYCSAGRTPLQQINGM
jgi:aspartate/methionine/tyrosine aminotransferase